MWLNCCGRELLLPSRYVLVILCFFANTICYMDRTNISVAIIPMSEEFNWGDDEVGYILSSFFYGYAVTQIPGSMLVSKYGAKYVLITGVFLWSLCTILTPVAAESSFELCLVVRIIMGLGEGVSLPCIHHLLATWIPKNERSRAVTLSTSGQMVGMIISLSASPFIDYSWRWCFYIWGLLGVIWCVFACCFPSHPPDNENDHIIIYQENERNDEQETNCNTPDDIDLDENQPILSNKKKNVRTWNWFRMFCEMAAIAIFVAHFCHNWGYYVILSWIPKYFNDEYDIPTAEVGFYAMLPYIAMFLGSNGSGWLSDYMDSKGYSLTCIRKTMQVTAFVLPSIFLLLIIYITTTSFTATVFLTFSVGFTGFSHAAYWANIIDISPNHAETVLGASNTLASIPGIVGNTVTGWILDNTGSWSTVFWINIIAYIFATIFYSIFAKGNIVLP